MSNLDPVIKAQLIKQVQDIANGMGETSVVKNEPLMPDTKIESNIKEQIGLDQPMQTNKIELVNQQPVVVEQKNSVEALTQESSQMTTPVKKIDPMIVTVAVVAILVLGGLFLANKFGNSSNLSANRPQYPQQQQPPYINNMQNNPYQYYPQEFNGPHLEQRNPGFEQQNFNPNLNNDIKSYVDRKLGVLEQRVDRLDHRTWLLAIANNENSVVSRKLAERLNASDLSRKYISFDSNWNLNKMPEFLRLTTEQRYSLLEEVDDRNYQKHYNYEYDYRTRTYKSTYVPPQPQQTYVPQATYVYPQQQQVYVYPQQSRNFNWQCR